MSDLKPAEIVKELDKYIIGQDRAQTVRGHCVAQPVAPAECE